MDTKGPQVKSNQPAPQGRPLAGAKKVGFVLFSTALLFMLIESICSAALWIKRNAIDNKCSPSAAENSLSEPWRHEYDSEFANAFATRWQPYVYWPRRLFKGDHINIGSDGLRFTPQPKSAEQACEDHLTIFVFGGSTVWGTGARDSHTIPALLAQRLHHSGLPCQVVNYGEAGYVSTQEVITLMLQLRNGNIPDMVVFWDGVNDTFSAFQQSAAGLSQNEFNRTKEFNLTHWRNLGRLRMIALQESMRRLGTVRVATGIIRRLRRPLGQSVNQTPSPARPVSDCTRRLTLPGRVAATLLENARIVAALGSEYGFDCLFYLQPTIVQKQRLTGFEMSERRKHREIHTFLERTYTEVRVQAAQLDRIYFRDLSGMFSSEPEARYIDWCHLSETGNGEVAEAILQDMLPLIRKGQLNATPSFASQC